MSDVVITAYLVIPSPDIPQRPNISNPPLSVEVIEVYETYNPGLCGVHCLV